MLKKLLGSASLLALVLLSSCGEYKTTDSGLRYKILADSAGEVAKDGEAIFFKSSIYKVEEGKEDSLIHQSDEGGILVTKDFKAGSIEEGLRMLTKGDSAEFLINVDSFFTFNGMMNQKPPFLKNAKDLRFVIIVTRVANKAEVEKERKERDAMMKQQAEVMNKQ